MLRASFILFFLFTASVARATEIDTFAGLEWAWPEAEQEIRLLGVFPHEMPLTMEKITTRYLVPKEDPVTRHGALLAHVMLVNGAWLQEDLVREGQAIVMPVFETNPERLDLLKSVEAAARQNKLGLWSSKPNFLHCADNARNAFDSFAIVQGRLVDAARVRGTVYLNFGEDWRTDFTAKITSRSFRRLPEEMRNALDQLIETDKPDIVIEARGWVYFEGGPMIEIKAAAQLDFYEPASPFSKGVCLS